VGQRSQLSPASSHLHQSPTCVREAIMGPGQPICQLNTTEWPRSIPHGAEVPSQALSTFLTHKIVRLVKMVVILSQFLGWFVWGWFVTQQKLADTPV